VDTRNNALDESRDCRMGRSNLWSVNFIEKHWESLLRCICSDRDHSVLNSGMTAELLQQCFFVDDDDNENDFEFLLMGLKLKRKSRRERSKN